MGCQSMVWIASHLEEKVSYFTEADSNAVITKGLVALLVRVFSGKGS